MRVRVEARRTCHEQLRGARRADLLDVVLAKRPRVIGVARGHQGKAAAPLLSSEGREAHSGRLHDLGESQSDLRRPRVEGGHAADEVQHVDREPVSPCGSTACAEKHLLVRVLRPFQAGLVVEGGDVLGLPQSLGEPAELTDGLALARQGRASLQPHVAGVDERGAGLAAGPAQGALTERRHLLRRRRRHSSAACREPLHHGHSSARRGRLPAERAERRAHLATGPALGADERLAPQGVVRPRRCAHRRALRDARLSAASASMPKRNGGRVHQREPGDALPGVHDAGRIQLSLASQRLGRRHRGQSRAKVRRVPEAESVRNPPVRRADVVKLLHQPQVQKVVHQPGLIGVVHRHDDGRARAGEMPVGHERRPLAAGPGPPRRARSPPGRRAGGGARHRAPTVRLVSRAASGTAPATPRRPPRSEGDARPDTAATASSQDRLGGLEILRGAFPVDAHEVAPLPTGR